MIIMFEVELAKLLGTIPPSTRSYSEHSGDSRVFRSKSNVDLPSLPSNIG
jgi:hypothetical protein